MLIRRQLINVATMIIIILGTCHNASAGGTTSAGCMGSSFSPWNDICWNCIYPIKLATVEIKEDPYNYGQRDEHNQAFCYCTYDFFPYYRSGTTFSYWEPLRYIETVKTPYCFPGMGSQMDRGTNGTLQGGVTPKAGKSMAAETFAQAHDWQFNTWEIMGMMLDSLCKTSGSFDLKYLTETDSQWNDDEVDTIVDSEKLLFANPVAQLSCAIDAVAATATFPLDVMFWCEGAWGSTYPVTGHIYNAEYTVANAALAGRLLFKLSRTFQLWDGAVNLCHYTPTIIWYKSHFKFQPVRPVADTSKCFPIGKPGFLWSYNKNIPGKTVSGNANDNFVWMIFSKKECCM